jgi:hypothetical protein
LCVYETKEDLKINSKLHVEYPFGTMEIDVLKIYMNFLSTIDILTIFDTEKSKNMISEYNDHKAWEFNRNVYSKSQSGSYYDNEEGDNVSEWDKFMKYREESKQHDKIDNQFQFVPFFLFSRIEFISVTVVDKLTVITNIEKMFSSF